MKIYQESRREMKESDMDLDTFLNSWLKPLTTNGMVLGTVRAGSCGFAKTQNEDSYFFLGGMKVGVYMANQMIVITPPNPDSDLFSFWISHKDITQFSFQGSETAGVARLRLRDGKVWTLTLKRS